MALQLFNFFACEIFWLFWYVNGYIMKLRTRHCGNLLGNRVYLWDYTPIHLKLWMYYYIWINSKTWKEAQVTKTMLLKMSPLAYTLYSTSRRSRANGKIPQAYKSLRDSAACKSHKPQSRLYYLWRPSLFRLSSLLGCFLVSWCLTSAMRNT